MMVVAVVLVMVVLIVVMVMMIVFIMLFMACFRVFTLTAHSLYPACAFKYLFIVKAVG